MKRIVALFLWLWMLFGCVACDEAVSPTPPENPASDAQTPDTPSDPAPEGDPAPTPEPEPEPEPPTIPQSIIGDWASLENTRRHISFDRISDTEAEFRLTLDGFASYTEIPCYATWIDGVLTFQNAQNKLAQAAGTIVIGEDGIAVTVTTWSPKAEVVGKTFLFSARTIRGVSESVLGKWHNGAFGATLVFNEYCNDTLRGFLTFKRSKNASTSQTLALEATVSDVGITFTDADEAVHGTLAFDTQALILVIEDSTNEALPPSTYRFDTHDALTVKAATHDKFIGEWIRESSDTDAVCVRYNTESGLPELVLTLNGLENEVIPVTRIYDTHIFFYREDLRLEITLELCTQGRLALQSPTDKLLLSFAPMDQEAWAIRYYMLTPKSVG